MALIRLHDEVCQDGETCPALYRRTARRTALVRGYVVTDPDTLAEVAELSPCPRGLPGDPPRRALRHAPQPATR